jgi:hypothetical protein
MVSSPADTSDGTQKSVLLSFRHRTPCDRSRGDMPYQKEHLKAELSEHRERIHFAKRNR